MRRFFIFLCCFTLAASVPDASAFVIKKTRKKTTQASSKKKRAARGGSKKSSRKLASKRGKKSSRRTEIVKKIEDDNSVSLISTEVRRDTILSPGVQYRHLIMGSERHSVHVLSVDRNNPAYSISILKGQEHCSGVECLSDITGRFDSSGNDRMLAAINANFWSAYGRLPIGPSVVNGEVVQLSSYKQWSSGFFDANSKLYIDRFSIQGSVREKNRRAYSINAVNYRQDLSGVVLYNNFGGSEIPYVSSEEVSKAYTDAVQNRVEMMGDSTEEEISEAAIREELANARRVEKQEFSMPKLQLRYLRTPAINREVPCLVLAADTVSMQMPLRGCIISYGKDVSFSQLPKPGDTVYVSFSTNVFPNVEFMNAVSGTPRLVRYGKAGHEAHIEGSTARRFISHNLARTAIGTDQTSDRLLFVCVDATGKVEGSRGATLSQMATIMKQLGAYNAMNLDGGGSTTMVVGDQIVTHPAEIYHERKISVGMGIVKKAYIRRTARSGS